MMEGSAVRDIYGARGRVLRLSPTHVRFGWEEVRSIVPREEDVALDDPRLGRVVEILTLDKGWLPFREVVHESKRPHGRLLSERSKHWPFKRKKKLGPGPDVEFGTRKVSQKNDWTCKCSNYVCACKGPEGAKKKVTINKAYKSKYNKRYKAWAVKKGKGKAKAKGKK